MLLSQLFSGSFLLYSFVIFPIAGYLISRERSYSRNTAVLLTISFFVVVAICQIYFEDVDGSSVNLYKTLSLARDCSSSELKKAYKRLSLELHPDKNRSPNAIDGNNTAHSCP